MSTLTLNGLLRQIPDAATPLVLETDTGGTQGAYHLTEIRHATLRRVDCAGRVAQRAELQVQVLDGGSADGVPMSAAKFAAILNRARPVIAAEADLPTVFEFAEGNAPFHLYDATEVTQKADRITIRLRARKAQCRPLAIDWTASPSPRPCCE